VASTFAITANNKKSALATGFFIQLCWGSNPRLLPATKEFLGREQLKNGEQHWEKGFHSLSIRAVNL